MELREREKVGGWKKEVGMEREKEGTGKRSSERERREQRGNKEEKSCRILIIPYLTRCSRDSVAATLQK